MWQNDLAGGSLLKSVQCSAVQWGVFQCCSMTEWHLTKHFSSQFHVLRALFGFTMLRYDSICVLSVCPTIWMANESFSLVHVGIFLYHGPWSLTMRMRASNGLYSVCLWATCSSAQSPHSKAFWLNRFNTWLLLNWQRQKFPLWPQTAPNHIFRHGSLMDSLECSIYASVCCTLNWVIAVCIAWTYADSICWSRVLAASAYQCVFLVPSTGRTLPGGQSRENEASAQGEKNWIRSIDGNWALTFQKMTYYFCRSGTWKSNTNVNQSSCSVLEVRKEDPGGILLTQKHI